jgi:hypothetical protein
MLGVLITGSVFLAVSCTGTSVFIPEAVQLEQPPIKVTADQLYQEYMADEAAADARYKGKEVWVTEAQIDTCLESESGCYLIMRWHPEERIVHDGIVVFSVPAFSVCTVKLEPQFSEGFKDVDGGYIVEIVGECQGISEGVVNVNINRIAKTGGSLPEPVTGW